MNPPRLLVTGMSGLIGGIVRESLQERYQISALNRRDVPGVKCCRADIHDFETIQPAFQGIDVVLHLAAFASMNEDFKQNLQSNIIGTYNVFESARRAGVKRVVFASSGAVVTGWEQYQPYKAIVSGRYDEVPAQWSRITPESMPRPDKIYGCCKLWGESMARHYSDTYDMSMICLRIGVVNQQNRPLSDRDRSIWCSHRDIAQIIGQCIAAPPDLRYDIFFGVSDNKWCYRDLIHACEVLGYQPQDSADDHD
jgi:nucleoside-diphosphate-sugar epimerase